jgi:hypothetical protein
MIFHLGAWMPEVLEILSHAGAGLGSEDFMNKVSHGVAFLLEGFFAELIYCFGYGAVDRKTLSIVA